MWRLAAITPQGMVSSPAGPTNFTLGEPSNVAALTDGHSQAQGPGIGEGNFHLCSASLRPQDAHIQRTLGPFYLHFLIAGKLARLGKFFFRRQLVALAKEDIHVFPAQMQVSRRCLDDYFCHSQSISFV